MVTMLDTPGELSPFPRTGGFLAADRSLTPVLRLRQSGGPCD